MTHPGRPLPSRSSLCATGMTHSAQSHRESWSFQMALSCHNQCLHCSMFRAMQQTRYHCWGLHTVSCHLRQRGLSYSHQGWRYELSSSRSLQGQTSRWSIHSRVRPACSSAHINWWHSWDPLAEIGDVMYWVNALFRPLNFLHQLQQLTSSSLSCSGEWYLNSCDSPSFSSLPPQYSWWTPFPPW